MMTNNTELNAVLSKLKQRSLGSALAMLRLYAYKHPELAIMPQCDNIEDNYRVMSSYWKQGFKDEHLDKVYSDLIQRTYRLVSNTYIRQCAASSSYLSSVYRRVSSLNQDWSVDVLRNTLETYVQDSAILELEPEHVRNPKKRDLNIRHQQHLDELFDYIRTSPQWTDGICEAYVNILLSPTIDKIDQQLIVSAITLATMFVYDINKWKILATVYKESTDEHVKQRALIGWVFALNSSIDSIFPEQKAIINDFLKEDNIQNELFDLQLQSVYCTNAEKVHRTIRDEIMPDIIKHNNFSITPNGIEEKEDDAMQDILDASHTERNMAALEEKFKRMQDMQKNGADIYFGGFAQMKRFPFFDKVSNWFMPFYEAHPEVSFLYATENDYKMANMVIRNGAFCDSDKYSFLIAFRQVIEKIPTNMREMLSSNHLSTVDEDMMGGVTQSDRETPAYIRRMYLQNLYRFYKLYPAREHYRNPFSNIFFTNKVFENTSLSFKAVEIAAFLIKQDMHDEALMVLKMYEEKEPNYNYCMLMGYLMARDKEDNAATLSVVWYRKALEIRPDSAKALKGYARALYDQKQYEKATKAYEHLFSFTCDTVTSQYNYADCLVALKHYDGAKKVLYRLHYEHPDNIFINRLLAKVYILTSMFDKAIPFLQKLTIVDDVISKDRILLGLCYWFSGDINMAVSTFAKYLTQKYPRASVEQLFEHFQQDIIETESSIIYNNGISFTEIHLMAYSSVMYGSAS